MKNVPQTQEEIKESIISEIQDLANSNGANTLIDFTLLALSSKQVLEAVETEAISKIYRLKSLIEQAQELK